jgi:mRNA interferase MazF
VIRQGDVYWVTLGEPGGADAGAEHPGVVVQNDLFNQSRLRTVVLCLLAWNLRLAEAPGNVLLAEGEARLPQRSVVNVTQMVTLDKRHLGDFIGALSPERIRQVLDGIALVLEPRTPDSSG